MRGVHSIMIRKICKKATVWLLAGVISLSAVTVQAAEVDNGASYPITTNAIEGWPQGPDTYSETAVLMDADTGTILYNKGMDEKRYPASITKIMTALLALENSNLDDQVTFTEECLADQTSDSGNIGMQVGEVLTMRQCLLALMIRSANDVATQIAVQIAGSVSAFADMMNQRAQELGCVNTHFVNASGMPDENHYTTAHDMALIMKAAADNESFQTIASTASYTIPATNVSGGDRVLTNNFSMLTNNNAAYYQYCTGGREGYTEASGSTLVCSAQKNGITLIAVVLQGTSGTTATEAASLLNYGFDNFNMLSLGDNDFNMLSGGDVYVPVGTTADALTTQDGEVQDGQYSRQYLFGGTAVGTSVMVATQEEDTSLVDTSVQNIDAARNYTENRNNLPYFIIGGVGILLLLLILLRIIKIAKS